jgi:hypothetical protein
MPPPNQYRRNPILAGRSEVLGEPPPAYYFPQPGQSGAFAPSYSPRQIGNSMLAADEFIGRRDDLDTKRVENFTRRLESGSRARTLPFTESATIAQQKLQTQRAESDARLNPFAESEELAKSKLGTAQAEASLQTLPQDVDARNIERDAAVTRIKSDDPELERLQRLTKSPGPLMAYEHYLDTAPKELKTPEARRKYAYNQSLRIAQDEDAVAALYESYADGKLDAQALDSFLEPVMGANGEDFGMRVKSDPKVRTRVRSLVAESGLRKERQRASEASAREARLSEASRMDSINSLIRSAQKRAETGDPAAAKEIAEWEAELAKMIRGTSQAAAPAVNPSAPANPVDGNARTRLLR